MRTTVTIDDTLLDTVKRLAVDEHRTVGSLVEDALRTMLLRRTAPPAAKTFTLMSFDGGEYLSGVDLADNAALLDVVSNPT